MSSEFEIVEQDGEASPPPLTATQRRRLKKPAPPAPTPAPCTRAEWRALLRRVEDLESAHSELRRLLNADDDADGGGVAQHTGNNDDEDDDEWENSASDLVDPFRQLFDMLSFALR